MQTQVEGKQRSEQNVCKKRLNLKSKEGYKTKLNVDGLMALQYLTNCRQKAGKLKVKAVEVCKSDVEHE